MGAEKLADSQSYSCCVFCKAIWFTQIGIFYRTSGLMNGKGTPAYDRLSLYSPDGVPKGTCLLSSLPNDWKIEF